MVNKLHFQVNRESSPFCQFPIHINYFWPWVGKTETFTWLSWRWRWVTMSDKYIIRFLFSFLYTLTASTQICQTPILIQIHNFLHFDLTFCAELLIISLLHYSWSRKIFIICVSAGPVNWKWILSESRTTSHRHSDYSKSS